MTSEITAKPTLAQKEWLARKGRIGVKMGVIVEFTRKSIMEILPDIRAIKEKKLWEHGGYGSFKEFCRKGLGVTQQHIYKSLADDEEARKVLEINTGESSYLTLGGEDAPAKSETTYEPPPKKAAGKSGRKSKPEPEPVEAEFTEEPKAAGGAQPTASQVEAAVAEIVPPAPTAFQSIIVIEKDGTVSREETKPTFPDRLPHAAKVCPHCGKEIE